MRKPWRDADDIANEIVRRHIEGAFRDGTPFFGADHPCRRYCLNGTLCQYHDGLWDGASEAYDILTQQHNTTKESSNAT